MSFKERRESRNAGTFTCKAKLQMRLDEMVIGAPIGAGDDRREAWLTSCEARASDYLG